MTSGAIDVVFTNATAARANDMDFGPPYLEIELGYLVPPDSPLKAWGLRLAEKAGKGKTKVAVARRLATVLLAMWKAGTEWNPDLLAYGAPTRLSVLRGDARQPENALRR